MFTSVDNCDWQALWRNLRSFSSDQSGASGDREQKRGGVEKGGAGEEVRAGKEERTEEEVDAGEVIGTGEDVVLEDEAVTAARLVIIWSEFLVL